MLLIVFLKSDELDKLLICVVVIIFVKLSYEILVSVLSFIFAVLLLYELCIFKLSL